MDLFRVETGTVPGQSCTEEAMPFLRRSPKMNEPAVPINSRVFLVSDSLASVANMSLILANDKGHKASFSLNIVARLIQFLYSERSKHLKA